MTPPILRLNGTKTGKLSALSQQWAHCIKGICRWPKLQGQTATG
jgi:hypothetical protein